MNAELNEVTLDDVRKQFEKAFSELSSNSSLSMRERKYGMVRLELRRLQEEHDQVYRDNPSRGKKALVAQVLVPNIHLQVLFGRLLEELE